ncbi:MAG TPA: TolC family protein [Thermoanaerobaculia bacterium]|nr:TolC family protein [Thermoanaerobaculia bacterium]
MRAKGNLIRWTLAAAVLSASAAGAQQSIDLSQAMQQARSQALSVQAAEERQIAAELKLRQAKGGRLPTLSLDETWVRTDSPAEAFAFKLNQERFSFPDFVAGDPNHPQALSTGITRFELKLPLYTGGELGGRIEQARLSSAAAGRSTAWASDQAALAAAEAYVHLAQAKEYVGLLDHSLETVRRHVSLARSLDEQGMLVRSDVLRAEVEESRVADLLSDARAKARVAEAALALALGAKADTQYELAPLARDIPSPGPLAGWLTTTAQRGDLAAARLHLDAGRLEEKVQRASLLPRVGFVARHDLVDRTLFGAHGQSTSLMAMASIELFAGGQHRAAMAAARAEAKAGARDLERYRRSVDLQVRQAWSAVSAARDRLQTAQSAVAAAREAERIVEDRFKAGVVKMIDLVDVSNARREAETRELVARSDAELALLELATYSGRSPESALASVTPAKDRQP